MRSIQKEIGLEDIISRIPSLFPYIDFDIYGDSPIYNEINSEEGLGILHLATDGVQGSYGHVMGSFKMPNKVKLYDNAVMYYPVSYINSNNEIITSREYNELSLYGRDCYSPYEYKNNDGNIIGVEEYNNLGQNCEKHTYLPYRYQNEILASDIIEAEAYRNKTKRSKYNYKAYECSNGEETVKFGEYGEDKKALTFVADRTSGEIIVNNGVINDDFEVYAVALKSLLIKPNETYSYRTMMNAYYSHYKDKVQNDYKQYSYVLPGGEQITDDRRWVNVNDKTDIIDYIDYHILEATKQPFITFIERGIGRYTIKECVEAYNNDNAQTIILPTYELNDTSEISYKEYNDSEFYNIEDVYECTKYVKVNGDGDNVYLYKNKIDGRLITSNEYDELDNVGANSYEAVLYQLTNGDSSDTDWYEIDTENYSDLFFYGQTSYVPYQYIDSPFLTQSEYNAEEEKDKYEPYTYINIYNDEIIPKSTYDSLKKNTSVINQYKVYRYVKIGYQTIFAYEYDALLQEYKEDYYVFSYSNTDKANDIITVEEYENLPKYGRMDYTAKSYAKEGDSTQISADDYYNLGDFGKEDYEISGYYNGSDVISKDDYINLNKPLQYQPYAYEPKSNVTTISQQQYTALPKYGFKNYQPYEYYAIINVSSENEEPRYQEFVITAEEYENDSFTDGTKQDYSPKTYAPTDIESGDNETDYTISYEEYDNISYFGQIDYNEIAGSSVDNQIDFEEDYENLFKDDDGNPIHDSLRDICPSIINGVVYLVQIDGILTEMKRLKKSYVLLVNNGLEDNDEIRCNYSKYLRMGGDNMVLLLEWLKEMADTVAKEMMTYAFIDNYVNVPINLSLTLQDNGYYTPAMNYKEDGMTVYKGEPFTYVDENGIADTYVAKDNGTLDVTKLNDTRYFTRLKDNNKPEEYDFKLEGKLDSKLKSLKSRRTYVNYLGQPETPSDGEDWLWYYVKGAIYDISMSVDDDGNLIPISGSVASGTNVLAYGSVLTDIVADNDTCTLTFTYYTDAHLKLVDNQFEIDTESDNGKYHGVKYTDTYNYERYGELYDLVERGSFDEYISNTTRSFERYPFSATANNVQTMIAGDRIVNIPFISSDFTTNFDYRESVDNTLCNVIYKEDLLNGIHYKPIVENEAFILRGTAAAFERHLRLGEVKTLEDLENYHNGSFFNIMNNF